ncbi:MAG: FlgD immunoglobulin-like domain containing protein [Candidatus Krumholzibacteriia bacterium]
MSKIIWIPVFLSVLIGAVPALGGLADCLDPDLVAFRMPNGDITDTIPIFSQARFEIVILNPSEDEIWGFEMSWTYPVDKMFPLAITFPVPAINIGDITNLIVGFSSPVVTGAEPAVIAAVDVLTISSDQIDFHCAPANPPSAPGQMFYLGPDYTLVPMEPISGDFTAPIGRLNGPALDYCGPPALPEFTVEIEAHGGGLADTANLAGTEVIATDGFDPSLDFPEPAPPPTGYLTAAFDHPGWLLGPRFRTDIRAPYDPFLEAKVWPLRIETDVAGLVTLLFSPSFGQDGGYGLFLEDLQSGLTFDLFPSLSYVFHSPGAGVYDFALTVGPGQVEAPPLDPTARPLAAGWAMVGLPLIPAPPALLGDVILDQAPGFAYLFDFQNGGYRLKTAADPALQGEGYWIATDAPFTWTMAGDRALGGSTLPLDPGWNLVGNPLWFPGPVEGIMVEHAGMSYTFADAVAMGLVAAGVWDYDATLDDYVDTPIIDPWHGYWIGSLTEGAALRFDWPNFVVLPASMAASLLPMVDPVGAWSLPLSVEAADGACRTVAIGAHPQAGDLFDPDLDRFLPPVSPRGGLRVSLPHPEWDLACGGAFSRDIRALSSPDPRWTLAIAGAVEGDLVLRWDRDRLPTDRILEIYLPGENRVAVADLNGGDSVRFPAGHHPASVEIRTAGGVAPVTPALGTAGISGIHPNPFNPRATIAFTLAQDGPCEVKIYSVRGELVASLDAGNPTAGSSHQVIWTGQDTHGRSVPSGAYFARLYQSGRPLGTVARMSLVR